jgi:broad specificity phosphatase PhoE
VKLNTTGLRQAEETGKTLTGMSMAAVYTSPLSRAKITAGKIAQFQKVSVVEEEGFTDMHFGEWQGLPLREVRERFRAIYDIWKIEPHKVKFSGGESLKEVAERSRGALLRLTEKHSEGTVCIVSHRVICKVMILNMLELPLSRFWNIRQDTCAINIFVYQDGMWTVERINDTCHLKSLEKERLSDF